MTTTHTNADTDTDTNIGTDADIGTNADADIDMVALDILDAAELAEICDYLSDWIGGAPEAVTTSLTRFGGPDAKPILLEALSRLADTLVRTVPSVSPTSVPSPTPLAQGETLGLVELLVDLSGNRWPVDADHAQAMADDCHRWAARLLNTPGMVR
jgi:hypothetical protein